MAEVTVMSVPKVESVTLKLSLYEANVLTDILAQVCGNDGKDVAYRLFDMLDNAKLGRTYHDMPYVVSGFPRIDPCNPIGTED